VLDPLSKLAQRHLHNGTLVLYDVTSTYFEGRTCPLAKYGYSRDGKRDKLQIVFGVLDQIVTAAARQRRPLRGATQIALRVGRVLGRRKMAKHFRLEITDHSFRYERNAESIATEAALDGIYVIRSNVPPETMSAAQVVRSYKRLSDVERGFRSLKLIDLNVRPIHHRLADRVRAHVLLCLLAYYVEWHLRRALAPLLFDDDDQAAAEAGRTSVVAPAQRSPRAQRKSQEKRTGDGWPVHSFRTLLADLATLTKNRIRVKLQAAVPFDKYTTPTPLQAHAFNLLAVRYLM